MFKLNMDSFTTQDCSHYSTAPFTWLTDIKTQERMPTNNITPGLFIKNDNPITANIDKESQLVGLHNIIGKCENVDVQSLNKAKELSSGLQRLYDVQNTKHDHSQQQFLNNTRLTQPEQSVTELNYNRFEYLPYNPQALNNVIQNWPLDERGGVWSRNEFKDNYSCPVADTRGGNH